MEAPMSPKSPRQQSEFLPAGLYESRHDIELQSPVTGSFLVNEKNRNFSSPSPPDTPHQSTNRVSHIGLGRQTPVRKYSRAWWEGNWNVAVAHRVWPRVLYATFGLLVMIIWIATTISFATEQIRWDRAGEQQFEDRVARTETKNNKNTNTSSLISLSGSLKSFDPVSRNLNVEWSGLFQVNYTSQAVPLATGTYPNVFWPLDIYRDVSTVFYDETYTPPLGNSTNATQPVDTNIANYWFRVDNGTVPHVGSIGMHQWDSFETDISFGQADDVSSLLTQPLMAYPFDLWSGSITFVANFHAPGEDDNILTNSGNYTGANIIPLAGARLDDNSLNWRFDLSFDNPCDYDQATIDKYVQQAVGGPVNATEYLADPFNAASVNIPCHLKIDIVASRPPLVQFAAVMAVIVNWTSTLFIFILTCETLLMRRGFMMSGTDLLGITFTSLFALPSVRLLLPGAPDFGALIDLVGIIPNVIIISLCITAIAITKLNRKRHPDQKED